MRHAACSECNSTRAWHWCPPDTLLPQDPLLSGDLGSWQKAVYMLPELGVETETSSVTEIKSKGQSALCVGGKGCFRVSLPAGQLLKPSRLKRPDTGVGGNTLHFIVFNSNDSNCEQTVCV